MKPDQVSEYPSLNSVLSPCYWNELLNITEQAISERKPFVLNIYRVFIDVTITFGKHEYQARDIINNEKKLNHHLKQLIGFLYSEHIETSLVSKYGYARNYINIFTHFAKKYDMNLDKISLSASKVTNDAMKCITAFKAVNPNKARLNYYAGWTVITKEGKEMLLHLALFRDAFGEQLTNQIHESIANHIYKLKSSTSVNVIFYLTRLLNSFTQLCSTRSELLNCLKPERFHVFMEQVLNVQFALSIRNNNDPKVFFDQWGCSIYHFNECFVETGVFEEPLKPFLTPKFILPRESEFSFSIGGELTYEEKERWLVDIPLSIKDDDVVEVVRGRLAAELNNIQKNSHKVFKEIENRQSQIERDVKSGSIKPLPVNHSKCPFPIGKEYISNTVATFYKHGFGATKSYPSFLGYAGRHEELCKVLNLPNGLSNSTLTSLLALEHPVITPGWLEKWQLYDKSGTMIGFKQSGNSWVAVSNKDRRGAQLSQQVVVLNDYSKSIVQLLIKQTAFSRKALKDKAEKAADGNDDWRYMMLVAKVAKPSRPQTFKGQINITENASGLAVESEPKSKWSVSLRTIRKARGLQIYLETRSLQAVAEALGHKNVKVELLGQYLPKPLMDYFNERWVRQFQNAIVYESLKESPYVFDAIDFDENELEVFLANHGLGELPENLKKAKNSVLYEKNQSFIESIDELVYCLSTPLLQVFIAIKSVVENTPDCNVLKPIVTVWYEAAVFVLSSLDLQNRINKDVRALYDEAKSRPIDVERFRENLLCH